VQQVGAAGRQAAGDRHDGHAVAALLSAHDAVVLGLTHTAITEEEEEQEEEQQEEQEEERETAIRNTEYLFFAAVDDFSL